MQGNGGDGKAYLLAMARAMQSAGRLSDFVVGLAHEGATGSLSTVFAQFGLEAFKGGFEARNKTSFSKDYFVDAYDAAIAAKRPEVVEWLAENKIPVVGAMRQYHSSGDAKAMHYNAVMRALASRDDRALLAIARSAVVDLNASLCNEIALIRSEGVVTVRDYAGANMEVVAKVNNPRLLDLCVANGLPMSTRAILDSGYQAAPSFFKVALGLNDVELINQSIGAAVDARALASKLLAAAASSNNLLGMRLALSHGADANALISGFGSKNQSRPLFYCSSADAVRLLCDAGANLELRNPEEMTPALYFASHHETNGAQVLEALIQQGADVTKRAKGRTIGQLAANRHESVKAVIRAAKTGTLVGQAIAPESPDQDSAPAPRKSGGLSML